MGRVVKWNSMTRVVYIQYHTGIGNLLAWCHKIEKANNPKC